MIRFKDLKLKDFELLWLKAIYENGGIPDANTFKVKLFGKLPIGFNYTNIHRTFLSDNWLNLFGLWVLNSENKVFKNLDLTIRAIKAEIQNNPKLNSISSLRISNLTGISIEEAKETLGNLVQHPGFWSSGSGAEKGMDVIGFSGDAYIDLYLNYKDVPTLLGETWEKFGLSSYIRPPELNDLNIEGKTQAA